MGIGDQITLHCTELHCNTLFFSFYSHHFHAFVLNDILQLVATLSSVSPLLLSQCRLLFLPLTDLCFQKVSFKIMQMHVDLMPPFVSSFFWWCSESAGLHSFTSFSVRIYSKCQCYRWIYYTYCIEEHTKTHTCLGMLRRYIIISSVSLLYIWSRWAEINRERERKKQNDNDNVL